VLLALSPFAPRLGLLCGGLAAGTFAVTSTFLVTGPAWEPSLGGFPALSPAGGFLIKDLALLGIALGVVGRMVTTLQDRHARSGMETIRTRHFSARRRLGRL
jgi:reactive chlorine resistance protein C